MPGELYIAVHKDLIKPDYRGFSNWKQTHGIKATDTTFTHKSAENFGRATIVIEALQFWKEEELNLFLLMNSTFYRRYNPQEEAYI